MAGIHTYVRTTAAAVVLSQVPGQELTTAVAAAALRVVVIQYRQPLGSLLSSR